MGVEGLFVLGRPRGMRNPRRRSEVNGHRPPPAIGYHHRMSLRRIAVCTLLILGSAGRASSADVSSASPDAPAVEVAWRGSLRAKAGIHLALVEPREGAPGALFEAPAFIELHNAVGNGSVVPWEYWRARIALAGGYRWRLGDFRVDALALIEHESDHATGPNVIADSVEFGFVNFNDVALTARVRRLVRHPQFVQLTTRLHVLTCTVSTAVCGAGFGGRGDRSFEASLEGSQELTLDAEAHWALFVAVAGDAIVATPLIRPARRLALRLGALWRRTHDVLSLSLYGLAGTDVGYLRGPDTLQGGVQLAWSLSDSS